MQEHNSFVCNNKLGMHHFTDIETPPNELSSQLTGQVQVSICYRPIHNLTGFKTGQLALKPVDPIYDYY